MSSLQNLQQKDFGLPTLTPFIGDSFEESIQKQLLKDTLGVWKTFVKKKDKGEEKDKIITYFLPNIIYNFSTILYRLQYNMSNHWVFSKRKKSFLFRELMYAGLPVLRSHLITPNKVALSRGHSKNQKNHYKTLIIDIDNHSREPDHVFLNTVLKIVDYFCGIHSDPTKILVEISSKGTGAHLFIPFIETNEKKYVRVLQSIEKILNEEIIGKLSNIRIDLFSELKKTPAPVPYSFYYQPYQITKVAGTKSVYELIQTRKIDSIEYFSNEYRKKNKYTLDYIRLNTDMAIAELWEYQNYIKVHKGKGNLSFIPYKNQLIREQFDELNFILENQFESGRRVSKIKEILPKLLFHYRLPKQKIIEIILQLKGTSKDYNIWTESKIKKDIESFLRTFESPTSNSEQLNEKSIREPEFDEFQNHFFRIRNHYLSRQPTRFDYKQISNEKEVLKLFYAKQYIDFRKFVYDMYGKVFVNKIVRLIMNQFRGSSFVYKEQVYFLPERKILKIIVNHLVTLLLLSSYTKFHRKDVAWSSFHEEILKKARGLELSPITKKRLSGYLKIKLGIDFGINKIDAFYNSILQKNFHLLTLGTTKSGNPFTHYKSSDSEDGFCRQAIPNCITQSEWFSKTEKLDSWNELKEIIIYSFNKLFNKIKKIVDKKRFSPPGYYYSIITMTSRLLTPLGAAGFGVRLPP